MIIAIDVETSGTEKDDALNPYKATLLGLSVAAMRDTGIETYWYPYEGPDSVMPRALLLDPTITKVGHNLRFDVKMLKVNGIDVDGPWEDTKLMAQLIDENRPLGLKPLATGLLGPDSLKAYDALMAHLRKLKLTMADLGHRDVDQDLVREYCCEDTANTLRLFKIFSETLKDLPRVKYYYDTEIMPIEKVLFDMEWRGNLIDEDRLNRADAELTRLVQESQAGLEAVLHDEITSVRRTLVKGDPRQISLPGMDPPLPAFNWNSGDQKTALFYGQLGLGKYCYARTESGKPSLRREHLARLTLPDGKLKDALKLQIKLQSYSKLRSAYVEGIRKRLHEGVIHGEYYQAAKEEQAASSKDEGGTVTGRLSHRNPNLGNLPARAKSYWRGDFVKDLFIPRPGHCFLHCDYSQIELRLAAHLSQDRRFLEAFNAGRDPHQELGDELSITRSEGKTCNFLLIYFGSPKRLAAQLGWNVDDDADMRKARTIHSGFFGLHPELHAWIFETRRRLLQQGWLQSIFGRRRHLPDVWSNDSGKQEHAYRQGGNFVVQNPAASITKMAMIELRQQGFTLVNQVHDAIDAMVRVEEAQEKLVQMKQVMESVIELSVPLLVDGEILYTFNDKTPEEDVDASYYRE